MDSDDLQKVGFKNSSGETIPGNAVMRVTGVEADTDGQLKITVAKPSTTFTRSYLINEQFKVPDGKFGTGSFEVALAAYDSSDGTPSAGETWGPKPDSWKLAKGYPGFTVLGVVNELAVVVPSGLQIIVGKTTDDITAGSTTDWAIHKGPVGSGAATTYTAPSAVTLIDLADGIWVKASWDGNGWFLEPLQCEAS